MPGVGNNCFATGSAACWDRASCREAPSSSAQATQNQTGQWVVDYTLSGSSKNLPASCKGQSGSQCWDTVAANNFHLPLAIELDGQVYSAPHHPADASHLHVLPGQR